MGIAGDSGEDLSPCGKWPVACGNHIVCKSCDLSVDVSIVVQPDQDSFPPYLAKVRGLCSDPNRSLHFCTHRYSRQDEERSPRNPCERGCRTH